MAWTSRCESAGALLGKRRPRALQPTTRLALGTLRRSRGIALPRVPREAAAARSQRTARVRTRSRCLRRRVCDGSAFYGVVALVHALAEAARAIASAAATLSPGACIRGHSNSLRFQFTNAIIPLPFCDAKLGGTRWVSSPPPVSMRAQGCHRSCPYTPQLLPPCKRKASASRRSHSAGVIYSRLTQCGVNGANYVNASVRV